MVAQPPSGISGLATAKSRKHRSSSPGIRRGCAAHCQNWGAIARFIHDAQPMVLGPQSETYPPLHAPDHVANRAVYSWQRFNELTCHVRQLERNVRTLTHQLMSSLANEVDME